ncbi:hypothetical protein PCANC_00314 [Puccinia coronata f. sp. avenae]|uniref:Uncharacterized protein n=1 Tax=Puccinia coronata f. sp. avenae TaxID=200324 RepID=A0A2N5W927_9BASI|nr:hypothetical protein PCANC_00314 [Puccinia coronata f. sp. avenae]
MAPQLRSHKKLCTCSKCTLNTVYNEQGKPISGQYLAPRNLAIHRSEEIKRSREIESLRVNQSNTSSSHSQQSEESNYSEESGAFATFDENENNFHLTFIILFITWLHIFCNVSRENCQTAVTILFNILQETLKRSSGNQTLSRMPRDPCTLVKKAAIKPHLVETVCCRICFHLYSFEQQRLPPTFCQYKRFANSDPCSEELWVQKSTHSGIKDLGQFPRPSKKDYPAKFGVPRCLYVSQPILAWLELLLRKPDIEAAIDAWASKVLNSKEELMDVQHGTTFQKLSQSSTFSPHRPHHRSIFRLAAAVEHPVDTSESACTTHSLLLAPNWLTLTRGTTNNQALVARPATASACQ